MRPIKLAISAFGPYADSQTLNFTELKDRSFFLICGPTGSGKTTILDAICFALYGDTSGNTRDGKQMRSDHADLHKKTEVTFDFSLGPNLYRVVRNPQQERPKQRGEGTTTMPPDATLWERTAAVNDHQEGAVLASGSTNVTTKIEELLGFKSNQFRQVVLLPQGEFRKLLLSKSQERQEILEALFKTEFYREIEQKLKQRAKSLENEVKELTDQKKGLLAAAGCENVEELKNRYSENQKELKTLTTQLETANKEAKKANAAWEEGKKIREKFHEKEEALKALQKLDEMEEEINLLRRQLNRAKDAQSLVDAHHNLENRKEETKTALEELNQREKHFQAAGKAEQKAADTFKLEEEKEPEREAANKKVIYLEDLTAKVNNLEKAKIQVDQNAAELTKAEQSYANAKKKLKKAEAELETAAAAREKCLEQVGKVSGLKAGYQEASRFVEKKEELENTAQELKIAKASYAKAEKALEKVKAEYLSAKEDLNELQGKWNEGQAAVLAQNLKDHEPCPVCGSLEHPLPAESETDIPSEDDLKASKKQVETLEIKVEKKTKELAALAAEKAKLLSRSDSLIKELGDNADRELNDLKTAAEELEIKLSKAQEAEKEITGLEKNIIELKGLKTKLEKQRDAAQEKYQAADSNLKAAQALLLEREGEVPQELQEPKALKQAQKEAKTLAEKLKTAYEAARRKAETASKHLTQAKTAFENSKTVYESARTKAEKAEAVFITRLKEIGFEDLQDYASAKRTPDKITAIEQEINSYEKNLSAAKDRIKRAEKAVADLEVPELEKLKEVAVKAEEERDRIFGAQEKRKNQVEQEKGWLTNIKGLDLKLEKLEEHYYVMGNLSDVANGKNEYGITFERFVLGALLDDVLVAATERLKLMSRGRYQLQRTLDRARRNSAAGLELEVFDTYTGLARPVGTLSGGETFLASLSLALGLADVVQAYSGGMRLDTIFVDEGFGTLDTESLDFAIKTLIDLQQGGRLVGIISHVPELKERIDARLEISVAENGSTAQFKLSQIQL